MAEAEKGSTYRIRDESSSVRFSYVLKVGRYVLLAEVIVSACNASKLEKAARSLVLHAHHHPCFSAERVQLPARALPKVEPFYFLLLPPLGPCMMQCYMCPCAGKEKYVRIELVRTFLRPWHWGQTARQQSRRRELRELLHSRPAGR